MRLLLPLAALQPLFWWWRRTVRQTQEELADAAAAAPCDRFEYAEALLAWARAMPERMPRGIAGSLVLWERPSQLKRRVAADKFKQDVREGRIDIDRLIELLVSSQQQLQETRQQLQQAQERIEELEKKLGGSATVKTDEAYSMRAEERRQQARGKKPRKKNKRRRGRLTATG